MWEIAVFFDYFDQNSINIDYLRLKKIFYEQKNFLYLPMVFFIILARDFEFWLMTNLDAQQITPVRDMSHFFIRE